MGLPYGAERWTEGTLPTDYRFTGQREESHLGLYHMGARFYDPALGRWLSADTIVPDPVNPQSLNRFSYCLNNPLAFVDPSGQDELWAWKNRWYNAHGWYWNVETGHWDNKGDPYFWDSDMLDEVIANSPETFATSEVGFHFELSFDQAALVLRASAVSWQAAGVSDLECLARSSERAANLSEGNPVSFMWLMNAVFGHTGRGLGNEGNPFKASPIGPYSTYGVFGDSGFASDYKDPYGNSDQVHHFWFYVQLSFWDAVVGSNSAVIGNLYHEYWPTEGGRSVQDYWLGNKGIDLGYRLGKGLSVTEVASFIRSLGP